MTANHRALLVIDMQNAFCHPDGSFAHLGMGLAGGLAAVGHAAVAVGQARRALLPSPDNPFLSRTVFGPPPGLPRRTGNRGKKRRDR